VDDRFTPTQVRFYGGRMRVGRGLLAVVSGSLLGLAACSGGGDDPVVLPSGTTDPTTTPTVTETTAVPPPTSEPTPSTTLVLPDEHVEEVDAFIRRFFEVYNAAQDSGDFSAFDAMYLPQCTGCLQMRVELEGWLADGGVVEGADWSVQGQSSVELAPGNFNALVLAHRASGELTNASGAIAPIAATELHLFNMNLNAAEPFVLEDVAIGPAE